MKQFPLFYNENKGVRGAGDVFVENLPNNVTQKIHFHFLLNAKLILFLTLYSEKSENAHWCQSLRPFGANL